MPPPSNTNGEMESNLYCFLSLSDRSMELSSHLVRASGHLGVKQPVVRCTLLPADTPMHDGEGRALKRVRSVCMRNSCAHGKEEWLLRRRTSMDMDLPRYKVHAALHSCTPMNAGALMILKSEPT
jgi:hypothetical protein